MPDVPSAVAYGSAAAGQAVYGTGVSGAAWAYSPWDSNTVTAAVTAGAGTSPPAPVVGTSPAATAIRGTLTWGTGTSPIVGTQVAVTFATALPYAPVVVLSPLNTATGLLIPTVVSTSTTGFVIGLATVPAASQGNTVYGVSWYLSL